MSHRDYINRRITAASTRAFEEARHNGASMREALYLSQEAAERTRRELERELYEEDE